MAHVADLSKIDKDKVDEFVEAWEAVDKKKPSEKDITKFREILSIHSDVWRIFADFTQITRQQIIEQVNTSQTSVKLSLQHGYEQVRTELGFDNASMLEKLLIEQVALAWLRHNWIECQYQHMQAERVTLEKAKYWESKLASSQRRFLRAITALARVRKLASRTPEILQVNIAEQQVNQVRP